MDVIQLLPDAIANQIAAGEVIQRPASVVKELVENAVDAGAAKIQLIVKDSGRTLVQVIDDGCGMTVTDARLAFERHATSKLRAAEDLFRLRTMGFRGEALASIAAVAQVEMKTRRQADELGTLLLLEGSEVKRQEPCQSPPGTSIAVKNLFFNVPARRNFLKSPSVEMRHINEEFVRIALAHPDIYFTLHHNGQEVYHLPPGNSRQRAVGVFGKNYDKRLVPVFEDTDVLKIDGFVGKPEFAKKSRGDQYFFVNDRFIKSSYLHHAVAAAFEELLPKDTHPFYVVFLRMDPARIDVNVHPTKQEIKFEDERLVYNYLKVAVRHALGRHSVMPTLDFEAENTLQSRARPAPRSGPMTLPSALNSSAGAGRTDGGSMPPSESRRQANNLRHWETLYQGLEETEAAPAGTGELALNNEPLIIKSRLDATEEGSPPTDQSTGLPPYQVHARYIVSQIKSGFLLIDQQAAHERILFERYRREIKSRSGQSQQQLLPHTVDLPAADADLLRDMLPDLGSLGFGIEPFGQNSFIIQGLPAEVAERETPERLIQVLLEQYRNNTDLDLETHDRLAAALARSAAIKRGQPLSEVEMRALIDRLFACELPYRSPFGRQCFLTFELDELATRFEA
jgi:DNA mismatch repair protein MutL